MNRRQFLRVGGFAVCGALSGCQGRRRYNTPSDCTTPFEGASGGDWPLARRNSANTSYVPTSSVSIADQSTKIEPGDATPLYEPIVVDGVLYAPPVSDGNFPHAIDLSSGEVQWRFERGRGITRPAFIDGRVIFCKSTNYDDEGRVFALDAGSGDQLWEFDLGGPTETVPHVADGTVFVTRFDWSEPSKLFALDVETGDVSWEFGGKKFLCEPAIAGGTVFLLDTRTLYALDAKEGETHWTRQNEQIATTSSPTVADGVLVVGERKGIRGIDACTGDPLWRTDTDTNSGSTEGVYTSPAIADGTVYAFVTSDQPEPAGSVQAFDLVTGERRWKTEIEFHVGRNLADPIVTDDAVILPRDPTILDTTHVLDREDGPSRRDLDVGGYSAVVVDGHLLLSHPDGVHAFEIG